MLDVGSTVAGYRITGRLGHGGMGEVFEAVQLSLDRRVALKVLSTRLRTDEGFRERFRREARLQAAIEHANIVPIFDFGEIDEGLYLAMRLVRGTTLKEAILARRLEPARTLRLLRPVADAVDRAHEAGLIHRDIKPHNILIGSGDHPFLADFGLTKGIEDTGLTKTGQFVGSTDYISPEQIRGEPAEPRSDVYALGAVLYECLTGIVPFPKASDAAVLYGHLQEPAPAVSAYRPDLPAALDDVIRCAMAKEPAQRYATATAMIEDFEDALGRHGDVAPAPAPGDAQQQGHRTPEEQVPTQQTDVRPAAPPPGDATTIGAGRHAPAPAEPAGEPSGTRYVPAQVAAAQIETRTTTFRAEPWTRRRFERGTSGDDEAAPHEPGPEGDPSARGPRFGRSDAPTARLRDDVIEDAAARSARTRTGTAARVPQPPPGPASGWEAAERAPLSSRRNARITVLAIAVPGLVALVAGFLLAGDDPPAARDPGPRTLRTAGVQVTVPGAWERNRADARRIGLGLPNPASAGPVGQPDNGLTVGRGSASVALPAALVSALAEPPGDPERVRFGAGVGRRYSGLQVRDGGNRLTVFLLPTTKGTAVVGCNTAATVDRAFAAACEDAARTLRPVTGEVRTLSPDADYGRAVAAIIDRLDRQRTRGRDRLDGAASSRAQRQAAATLAGDFTTARKAVAALDTPAGDEAIQGALERALGASASAYERLARAAGTERGAAYASARRAVGRADTAVNRALAAYERAGYQG